MGKHPLINLSFFSISTNSHYQCLFVTQDIERIKLFMWSIDIRTFGLIANETTLSHYLEK